MHRGNDTETMVRDAFMLAQLTIVVKGTVSKKAQSLFHSYFKGFFSLNPFALWGEGFVDCCHSVMLLCVSCFTRYETNQLNNFCLGTLFLRFKTKLHPVIRLQLKSSWEYEITNSPTPRSPLPRSGHIWVPHMDLIEWNLLALNNTLNHMINFNGMSSRSVLFYTDRLENRVHFTLIFKFYVVVS